MNVNGKSVFKLAAAAGLIALGITGNASGQSSNGQGGVIPPPPRTNGVGGQQNGNFAPKPPALSQQPQQFVPPGSRQPQQQVPDFTSPPQVQQPQAPSYVDDGLPELVKLFSAAPIDQVFMNGKPADGRRVSDTVVEIFIVGDENGYPCTNIFDIIFGDGQVGKLTANHCHGETEFAVIPGETLNHEETHDGNIDERASGIDTLSSDFQWSYFADATRTGLQVGVPETDNVMFFAECQRGTSNALVYMFVAPQGIQLNQHLSLAVVVDGGATENYEMGVTNFPYLEAGPVPAMQIGTNHPFFEDLAGGQIADFYVSSDNDQAALRILLKGSAKPVRSFAAACSSR
ncbi:MAG: hypothetical protein AB8B94_13870 [Hyphomicrobiales bacterium]